MSFAGSAAVAYKRGVPAAGMKPINAATRYCAVLGYPVRHSASPAMQNAGLEALGLNWRYLAFEVHADRLPEAMAGARAMKFAGLNLTIPHKQTGLGCLDLVDPSAEALGAVNTIRFEALDTGDQWLPLVRFPEDQPLPETLRSVGFNTDAEAILQVLRHELKIELPDARVAIAGAGGAGRVAALQLAGQGVAELFLINRTAAKAEALAKEVQRRFPPVRVTCGYPPEGILRLLINATSLGLRAEDPLPIDPQRLPLNQVEAVFDMIYRPARTPLLKAAEKAGCRTANGLGMLLYQGAQALEIWTLQPAPLAAMRAALERHLAPPQT